MAKFAPLADYCRRQTSREFRLSFVDVQRIISAPLPPFADRPQYWANTKGRGSSIREALRHTPYDTFHSAGSQWVEFRRRH